MSTQIYMVSSISVGSNCISMLLAMRSMSRWPCTRAPLFTIELHLGCDCYKTFDSPLLDCHKKNATSSAHLRAVRAVERHPVWVPEPQNLNTAKSAETERLEQCLHIDFIWKLHMAWMWKLCANALFRLTLKVLIMEMERRICCACYRLIGCTELCMLPPNRMHGEMPSTPDQKLAHLVQQVAGLRV